ncbi:MAG TPA: PadR family transcriptional regulator [Gemmatimonadaceae bacterium]|jgi:transcriptional regulator
MPDAIPLVRGTLDILVLKTLSWGSMHSFEIIAWLEDRSRGKLNIDDSALLQAFHRMEERGLVSSKWGMTPNNRKARYYQITAKGRAHLKAESAKLAEYTATLAEILDATTA